MKPNFSLGSEMTTKNILRSGFMTVGEAIANNAKRIPDRIAVEHDGGKLSFAQLNSQANRLANSLLKEGVARGDRVAILSQNRVEYCELPYAAAKIGAIMTCLNWRQSKDELRYCINLTTPETVFVSSEHRETFESIKGDLPFIKRVVLLDEKPEAGDEISYRSLMENGTDKEPFCEVVPEDGLTIIYTSGTTGYPKAAVISHRAIFGRTWGWVQDMNLTYEDTFLGWSPMFHMASMDQMLVNHILGGKFICIPGFDPEKIFQYSLKERLGWFVLMPGAYEFMIDLYQKSDKKPLGAKWVGAMADLTPPNIIAEITRLTNSPFCNTFGSTETGLAPASKSVIPIGEVPVRFSKKINSICLTRLVDMEDNDVPMGEPGEIILRGPSLCSGYWGDEETNAKDFRNGWFHMGDVFKANPDGTIDFVDRRKYLIKSGGENIYPAEIERVLMSHPSVAEAVVVRYPDEKWGETPKAYIAISSPVTDDELMGLCKKNLAGYKKPRHIEIIPMEKFPRSTTGKVQRHEIEKWHEKNVAKVGGTENPGRQE